ncbi:MULTISPECIES: CPBP family intramembrane glutamic endopeptidase [Haloferax]|uniref:CPBP family intramembrane metalloprotease n=1 Tax=Haloferax marinum TaxID=2666143 RepID=A0A6A8G5Y1_9EURY|nr:MULTISPECIES: type II CAAX endopeptidase family protein [Haloferax]KAB1196962.1 CPBP family intramembrane metalloprotease [Haloferax sp. CBA1150]MRW95982.1 CPBP family intramembrane metalloprotease [Haloferax marinum]
MSTAVDSPSTSQSNVTDRLRAVIVAVAVVAAAIILGVVLTFALFVPLLVGNIAIDPTGSTFLILALIPSQLAFALVGILVSIALLGGVSVSLPTRTDLRWVALGLVGSFAAVALLVAASTFVDLSPVQSVVGEAAGVDPTILVALALLSIFVIAPAEELLFRGAVQGRLRETFGPLGAIVLASAIFASLHAFNFIGGGIVILVPLSALFLVGSVFGYVYERTENLAVPIAVHGLYNATLFLSSFVLG